MQIDISNLASQYLSGNYDYLWLKTMLAKCGSTPLGSSLITGSSHALNGIWEGAWAAGVPEAAKDLCEKVAMQNILSAGTYYSQFRARGTFFNLQGRTWAQVTANERQAMGKIRAESHNKLFQHKASFEENKRILQEFVSFLYAHDVTPIVVITPFTPEYDRFVLKEMKASVLELIDSVQEDVHYVDFNENAQDLFVPSDFMDTDHLSLNGAKKVSGILAEMFRA